MAKDSLQHEAAQALGAADAKAMVAAIPHLSRLLTSDQIAQFQKILDAAVLNPTYQEAYKKAYKASVISRSGPLVLHDEAKKRKANKIIQQTVRVSEYDHYIRLDYQKMLTPDALLPETNNPDEAEYLDKVRGVLTSKGIWLRLRQPWGDGPDPRVWEFAFSIGAKGDVIDTNDAIIDRDELLQTGMLGVRYFTSVLTGPVQSKIARTVKRLDLQYNNGWALHMEMIRNRRRAVIGVAKISEVLGGADMPNTNIWNLPHKLRMTAWDANTSGDVVKAQVYLILSAQAVKANADLLSDYTERTIDGADTAVSILNVAKTAGQVAEVVLMLTGVGLGVKALRASGTKALTGKVRDEATEQFVREYAKKNGISMSELASVRYVKQPPGTTLGNVKGGHSAGHGSGFSSWP